MIAGEVRQHLLAKKQDHQKRHEPRPTLQSAVVSQIERQLVRTAHPNSDRRQAGNESSRTDLGNVALRLVHIECKPSDFEWTGSGRRPDFIDTTSRSIRIVTAHSG